MSKNKFNIELPFFCGYYESPLYNSDTLYWETNDEDNMEWYRECFGEDITADDLDIDFTRYKEDCNKAFAQCFEAQSPEFVEQVEFTDMVSPRYYNYATDKIYADVTLSDNWREVMLNFIKENKEWLIKRIAEDWTSCDGFMSFMDNYYDAWLTRFENDTDEEFDVRYLSTMIGYMMYKNDKDIHAHLIEDTLEDFYVSEYIICTKEREEEDK